MPAFPGNGAFAIGKTLYPLAPSTANSLLADGDQPIYWLLQYFASELQTYLGARWTAEMARAGLSTVLPHPVGMKFPNNPFPYLQDTGAKFPILAIYRVDGVFLEKTASFEREQSNLEIAWVLPPLTMSQMEIVGPFLKNVMDVIQDRSEIAGDPNFMDGYNWGDAAGFDWLQMGEYQRMMIPHTKTNLPMESVVFQLKMRMRNMPYAGAFPTVDVVTTEIDLIPSADGYVFPDTIYPNFVDMNSNYTPSNFPDDPLDAPFEPDDKG
jgi:hypothetical protein